MTVYLTYFYHLLKNESFEMGTTISMFKVFILSGFGNLLLLKTDILDLTQFGIAGVVIAALFGLVYALLRPTQKMQAEQMKIDNELKVKMSQNIEALNILIIKQGLKTESNFKLLTKEIEQLQDSVDDIKK